ncbi:MAG: MFS transporter [Betaproteobacteria bacterium]|nr:MFS transporter [Betaproteobacteria bacterium]
MKNFFRPYATFLRLPDVTATLVMAWFARLPIGMTALSMLLFLRETLGSYQSAGALVGTYFLAIAGGAPFMGRIIDRKGPRRLLILTGLLQPSLVLALYFAASAHLDHTWLLALAVVAGAFSPPITVLTRTVWRHRFESDVERRMAFSVDSVFVELNFTAGPSLVAIGIAAFGASTTFLITIAVMYLSPWIYLRSPALKYWRQEPHGERHPLGPLTDLSLVSLFVITLGLCLCFGLMEVGYPAYATSIQLTAFGGWLLAINSVGSAIGGALYGGLHLRISVERQFSWLLALIALPLALHGYVDQTWLFAVVAFFAGAAIAPAIAAQNLLVSRMAPAQYATEAFTWSSTFIVCGLGAGMALGGAMAEQMSAKAPFLLGSAIALAMAVAARLLLRRN